MQSAIPAAAVSCSICCSSPSSIAQRCPNPLSRICCFPLRDSSNETSSIMHSSLKSLELPTQLASTTCTPS
eukprot:935869-Rhodomonas_salina.1